MKTPYVIAALAALLTLPVYSDTLDTWNSDGVQHWPIPAGVNTPNLPLPYQPGFTEKARSINLDDLVHRLKSVEDRTAALQGLVLCHDDMIQALRASIKEEAGEEDSFKNLKQSKDEPWALQETPYFQNAPIIKIERPQASYTQETRIR